MSDGAFDAVLEHVRAAHDLLVEDIRHQPPPAIEEEHWVLGPDNVYRRQPVLRVLWAPVVHSANNLATYAPALEGVRAHPALGPLIGMEVGTDLGWRLVTAEWVVHAAVTAL